jgi:hypothetical protein
MRPRFELGVDTTEYWGSTKKFITVPVGRVHTLPARFSTDLHGLFTELRVEIRDTSRGSVTSIHQRRQLLGMMRFAAALTATPKIGQSTHKQNLYERGRL